MLPEAFAELNKKVTLSTDKGTGKRSLAALSEKYAQQASGNTYGFVSGSNLESIFNTYEYPALQNNTNETNVFTELLQGEIK